MQLLAHHFSESKKKKFIFISALWRKFPHKAQHLQNLLPPCPGCRWGSHPRPLLQEGSIPGPSKSLLLPAARAVLGPVAPPRLCWMSPSHWTHWGGDFEPGWAAADGIQGEIHHLVSLGSWLPHSNVVFSSQSQGVSCGGSESGELVLLQVPIVAFLEGTILPLENREIQSHSLIPAKITLLSLHLLNPRISDWFGLGEILKLISFHRQEHLPREMSFHSFNSN